VAVAKHKIPVNVGQLRYLLSLEPYRDQQALADKLGTSARYIRWMLSGEKPGYKHSPKIWKLYQLHRRKGTPVKVPTRLPPTGRDFVAVAGVVSVLRYLFQPTDASKIPPAYRPWQDRVSRYITTERKVRGTFKSWDAFSIVMVQGRTETGVISIKRYRPKGGGQPHLDFSEERELSEEGEDESESIMALSERWGALSRKNRDAVKHLPIEEWIDAMGEIAQGEVIFDFWVTRLSEMEKRKGSTFGNYRDPRDPQTLRVMEANVEQHLEMATEQNEHFQYDLVGVYGFTGWNKWPGKHKGK